VSRGVYDTIPTPADQRNVSWARAAGWSEPADVFEHLRIRCAVLPLLAHGPRAVSVGLGALVLHGVQGLPHRFRGEVVMPDGTGRLGRETSRVRRFLPGPEADLTSHRVVSIDAAIATGVLALRRWSRGMQYGVVALSDVKHRRLADADQVARSLELVSGRRGAVAMRPCWELARAELESPAETWAYLSFIDEGCPPDALQLTVLDVDGGFVGRVDFAWLLPDGTLVVVEIDGAKAHEGPAALVRDGARQNQLMGGAIVLRYSGRQAMDGTAAADVAWRLRQWGRRGPSGPLVSPFRLRPIALSR
jgi:hypothetical protein